jgi:hypothetical protein
MPSVTTWTRLEPRARSADLAPGLEARVHDPLWMIARQWQLGELTGEDAASPASVRVVADVAPLAACRLGGGPVREYDRRLPLEVLVEREPAPDLSRDLTLSAEAGLHFTRMLEQAGMGAYRAAVVRHFGLPAGEGMPALLAGRAPHAAALATALAPGDVAAVRAVADAWLLWLARTYTGAPAGQDAWDATRMEYRFELAAPGTDGAVGLRAAEYHGGRLDWYDFEHAPPVEVAGTADTLDVTVAPAVAAYPGMPVDRWWEFEDARVDFGRVEAEPGDLARMLVAEYGLIYSNDWFLVPVELPAGSVCRVRALLVRDVFGGVTRVNEAGTGLPDPAGWSLFRLGTPEGGRSDVFFLPPALPDAQEGPPVEEVRFFRDEMANLAWAVEARVQGPAGVPVDRHLEWAQRRAREADEPRPGTEEMLVYRVSTEVPEHWFALNPEEITPGSMRLRLLTRQRPGPVTPVEVEPLGRVLSPGPDLRIFEEEVPREGIRVQRAWQLARGSDGDTHLWIGRRKTPGRGEGSSGLRWDVAEPGSATG